MHAHQRRLGLSVWYLTRQDCFKENQLLKFKDLRPFDKDEVVRWRLVKIDEGGSKLSMIPEETLKKLLFILLQDDFEQFKAFLKVEKTNMDASTYPELLQECFSCQARECAAVMLNGPLADYPRTDALRMALHIYCCNLETVKYFFDDKVAKQFANHPCELGYLPIHKILHLFHRVSRLRTWDKNDSLVNLLFRLCQPNWRKKLDCARWVANHTDSLCDVAASFLINGDIVELAALLLISHSTILPRLKSVSLSIDGSINGIDDMISRAIVGKLTNPAGLGLIDIFDKAGDSLSIFYTSMPQDISGEDLIKSISRILLVNANIPTSEADVKLEVYSSVDPSRLPSLLKDLGIEKNDRNNGFFVSNSWKRDIRELLPVQRKQYSATAFQSPKISVTSQDWSTITPSSKIITFLSTRLKRGIRFL